MTQKERNVVIVYHTLPHYRFDFFNRLHRELLHHNRKLVVIAGVVAGKKVIKEPDKKGHFGIDRYKRVGFSIFEFQIEWGAQLIGKVFSYKPCLVIFMYNAGILNNSLLMMWLRFNRIPYMIWGSGHRRVGLSNLQYKLKSIYKNIFMRIGSGLITYSKHYANELVQLGYDRRTIFCAQNTINVEQILESYKKIPKSYFDSVRKFLFVGALIPQKKLDKALYAFRRLRNEKYSFVFNIVGEGIIKRHIVALIQKMNLQDVVFCHGGKYGEDLAVFFQKADVFILPGTGGLAINEAMAHGLAIISTPGDGTGYDLVRTKENGFLLEYEYDVDELYEVLKYFLNCNRTELSAMGEKSLEMVKRRATLKNMVDGFMEAVLSTTR